MSVLGVIRIVCLVLASVFALIVLGIAAGHIALTGKEFSSGNPVHYFPFAALALAIGVLTILTLPVLLIVDTFRAGAWTSMILVEQIVSTILWALWLATASYTTQQAQLVIVLCEEYKAFNSLPSNPFTGSGFGPPPGYTKNVCDETKAIEGFSYLTWLTLLTYSFVLLVFTFIASGRGHNVWFQSVKYTNFFAPSVDAEQAPTQQMPIQYPANFAPQQQMYGMQQPMQGIPFQNPQFQGVPFQGSPMQPSSQLLPMQGPLQNFNQQGFSPQQFQTPLPQFQTIPTSPQMSSLQMSSPQMSSSQLPSPQLSSLQTSSPQMTTHQIASPQSTIPQV